MRDYQVRKQLLLDLQQEYGPNDLLLSEFGVNSGSSRIDVAVINGFLHGFEIKSDNDTLDRLPHQIEAFGQVFDHLTLVVGSRHLREARQLLPPWWGVRRAVLSAREDVLIRQIRKPRQNPRVDKMAVARLLWRDEVLSALSELGIARGFTSKPRGVLWSALAEAVSVKDLRRIVNRQIKARTGWRPDRLQGEDDVRSLSAATG